MTFEKFTEIINTHKEFSERAHNLYMVGVDMLESKYELNSLFITLFDLLLTSHYNEEGKEWIEWFIYESDYGERDWSGVSAYKENEKGEIEKVENTVKHGAHDVDGNPICYDMKSLYEYVETNCKIKKKCSKKCSESCGCQI